MHPEREVSKEMEERDEELHLEPDDVEWRKLASLEGQPVVTVAMWEESLLYAEADVPGAEQDFVDFDLYLANHTLLELYGVSLYEDLDSPPMKGAKHIEEKLRLLASRSGVLTEVSLDGAGLPVLVLTGQGMAPLWAAPTGWIISHWERLP